MLVCVIIVRRRLLERINSSKEEIPMRARLYSSSSEMPMLHVDTV